FLERRNLGIANVVDLDDVPAELRFNRSGRELALWQGYHRVSERLDEIGRGIPVQIAAVGFRAGVLRAVGELLELLPLLQRGDDFLRLVFLVDQDMANLVFLVTDLALDRVVLL